MGKYIVYISMKKNIFLCRDHKITVYVCVYYVCVYTQTCSDIVCGMYIIICVYT